MICPVFISFSKKQCEAMQTEDQPPHLGFAAFCVLDPQRRIRCSPSFCFFTPFFSPVSLYLVVSLSLGLSSFPSRQIDKFMYSSEDYIKAGAVLALGIISRLGSALQHTPDVTATALVGRHLNCADGFSASCTEFLHGG